jgi:hypothetical protein
MTLSREEKLDMMRTLNWDYLDKSEDMLAVIEGNLDSSGAFTRDRLFVRSLERLSWYSIIGLWGVETVKRLYTPELAGRIWPKSMRQRYDFALAVLRRAPISTSRWGDEHYKQMRNTVFSNRWYRA